MIREAIEHAEENIRWNVEEGNLTVFSEIQMEPPYTTFNVMIDPAQYLGYEDGLFPMFFYAGGHYQAVAGTPLDEIDVTVNYISKDTGELIISGTLREKRERDAARAASVIDIEDIVVVDNGQLRITIKELYPNETDGYGISAELENFTEDTWSITVFDAAVNGLKTTVDTGCEVSGGQKTTHVFLLPKEALAAYGVMDITDITLTFNVSNSSTMPTLNVVEGGALGVAIPQMDAAAMINWFLNSNLFYGPAHICPYGEEKIDLYERAPQAGDSVIYDTEIARVTMFDGAFDAAGGYSVQFYLENRIPLFEESAQRRSDLAISIFHLEVNGEVLPNSIETVNVGQRSSGYVTVAVSAEDLQSIGVGKVQKIDAILSILDTETGEYYTKETFRIYS